MTDSSPLALVMSVHGENYWGKASIGGEGAFRITHLRKVLSNTSRNTKPFSGPL